MTAHRWQANEAAERRGWFPPLAGRHRQTVRRGAVVGWAGGTVRVLTWNLWWRFGDWRRRLKAIDAVLKEAHGRTALAAKVVTTGGELPVVCTHLAAHPAASAERCAQVRVVVDVVDVVAALGRSDVPPVVAGDLNAEPDSDEVRLLGGSKTAPAVAGLFLVDAWRAADDTDPGWTWRRENPHASKYGFNARIDYIHVGAIGPNGEGTVRQVQLAGHREVSGVWPSDHAAVVADLAM